VAVPRSVGVPAVRDESVLRLRFVGTFVLVALLWACSDAEPSEPRLLEGILGRIESVDWPVESPALQEMIEALPEELGGFERIATRTFGDAAAYPDTSPGAPPYAGITISVIDPLKMEGLTSVQMLQATIGLAGGLEDEERSLDEGAEFAYISGRVVVLEGVGEIPEDEPLFIIGWTQPPDGAVFLVQAGSIEQRDAAILALIDAASLGE
jgi:hypothetical protein